MPSPTSMILRFEGEPDDLAERFEQALKASSRASGAGCPEPLFFAISKAENGIVIVSGWRDEDEHKAFRKQLMPHLGAAGITRPSMHEQFEITTLGWSPED